MWKKEINAWDDLYKNGSSRAVNEGDAGIYYRLPKFVEMFRRYIPNANEMSILEIGGGVGEMCDLLKKGLCNNCEYTVTEYSVHAVEMLEQKYEVAKDIHVSRENAERLSFPDNSFDIVTAYDVMHHVGDPQKMADEMLRVSRHKIFLCDACGVSVIRKLGELSASAKALGEKSYSPRQFRKFFHNPDKMKITPFYFFVPPKLKKECLKPFIVISEIGQRIPVLKYQSQSLAIYIEKDNFSL